MTHLQAAVLGLIQGLTEFLPISSSAHLALAPWVFGWRDPGLTFDIALHAGTLLAVLAYFWCDWMEIFLGAAKDPRGPQARLLAQLAAATIPAAAAGLLIKDLAESALRSPPMVAALMALFALALEAADRSGRKAREIGELGWSGALAVGLAQMLALAPGVSRSGVTMTAALMLGLTRPSAARFSFLLSTPITAGACLMQLRHLGAADVTGPFVTGVVLSAVSGLAAVSFLISRLKRTGMTAYTVYRLAAAAGILALWVSRR